MRTISVIANVLLIGAVCRAAPSEPDFKRDVAPIFEKYCVACHNAEKRQGKYSLHNVASAMKREAIVAGKPDDSEIIYLVETGNADERMPKDQPPLAARDLEMLRRWITAGARWPDGMTLREKAKADASWWSLQMVKKVEPPSPKDIPQSWKSNPIDRFIYARLASKGLEPSPRADARTLIRRLYVDLIGLPPTPEEVEVFIADFPPPSVGEEQGGGNAAGVRKEDQRQHSHPHPSPPPSRGREYEALVDRLLASEHFGERWARHWLDIVHYADTHGFERDKRRDHAWRYRDYVIRAFNEDKPYNRFLLEQIAGDVIAPDNADAVVATGFLAAGPWDFVGQVETKSPVLRRSTRALDLDDMVTQVMTSTMAMTINCARCHDHKLDPITQKEYYKVAAVFAGLKRADRDISSNAKTEYAAKRKKIDEEINRVDLAIGELQGKPIDLADIVGGGNGFVTGRKGIGLDPRTGKVQERPFGGLGNVKPGNYAMVAYPFVDGVFNPSAGETTISSTGMKVSGIPKNARNSWDMIRNGPVAAQYSTKLGTVDYNAPGSGHSLLGIHANAGITFDLDAIRNATNYVEMRFSAVGGYGGRTVQPSAEFRVYLDGKLMSHKRVGRNDAVPISFGIGKAARFLTIISTDGGNNYSHDQISFGDARIYRNVETKLNDKAKQKLAELRERRKQLEEERRLLGEPPTFFGVVASKPPPVHVFERGNPEVPGEEIAPGRLSFGKPYSQFESTDMSDADRRRSFAIWIIDPRNSLTARVIVNRLWHWHFGQGLVSTPGDFGYGGDRPSHPQLLDWLANKLVEEKWSLKAIHRLIVTSQTYQQTSTLRDKAVRVDADNRLLWRMNVRRLEAEAVRDSVLAVTGKLNRQMYGPGYRDFNYQEAYAPIYTYKTADSPDLWRRSVYRYIVRTTPQPFMTTLDCPDPANLTPKRNVTTTALQSLALFNNDFMLRQARYFAQRVEEEAGDIISAQVDRAFQLAFSRLPSANEKKDAIELIEEHGLLHLCRALLNANEFVYVD